LLVDNIRLLWKSGQLGEAVKLLSELTHAASIAGTTYHIGKVKELANELKVAVPSPGFDDDKLRLGAFITASFRLGPLSRHLISGTYSQK
jgi:hypothetical protein